MTTSPPFKYPRRRVLRFFLRSLSKIVFSLISDLEIIGQENIPEEGPVIVVANHFNFIDPVLMMRLMPHQMEFIGGFNMPNAPIVTRWLPSLWGYLPVYRGTTSRDALRSAEYLLNKDGVLGIFPEAGSWAQVLRPARPGTAFLAVRTQATILPMGFYNLPEVFPTLRRGKRAKIVAKIGEPLGPYQVDGHGRARRDHLEEIGHEIMGRIAELIPPEKRGFYSDDPVIREAAKGTEIYPWDEAPDMIN